MGEIRSDAATAAVPPGGNALTITAVTIGPLVALLAGILILIIPRLLNYIVAIYLIVVGVLGLWPDLFDRIGGGG